jgi:hypothetical protein
MCGALSDERRVCRSKLLLALVSAVILRSKSRGTHDHILLSQILDCHNLDGEVPVFISPRNRVAQLYPPGLGSLFVASYDSHDCSGYIRTRLHTGGSNPCIITRVPVITMVNLFNCHGYNLLPRLPHFLSVSGVSATLIL